MNKRIKDKTKFNSFYKSRKLLRVSGQIEIQSKATFIWKTLTAPNHLLLFNCYIKHHSCVEVATNHSDECVYNNDTVLIRNLVEFVPNKKLKYKIWFKEELKPSYSTFEILTNDLEPNAIFKLTLETDAYKNVPRPIWHFIAAFFIIPRLKKYINSILLGMEQYATSKNPPSKNQFGYHKNFS